MELITLRQGQSEAVLAPHIGGGILSWTERGAAMLRHPLAGALDLPAVRNLAAFPLIPFSNRIDRGRFDFAGQRYELAATAGGHAIHGVGLRRPWQVTAQSGATASLALDHAPDELWPFAFHAEQTVTLEDAALSWHMRLVSRHDGPAPAGLGFHTYFPRPDATLRFAAGGVWFNAHDEIPMRHAPVPQDWNHAGGRRVGNAVIDNCFTGWDGSATIDYGSHRLELSADRLFRFAVVFVPDGKEFFAVEPVSHMNNGINRMHDGSDHGIVVLEPGATLEGGIRIARHGGDAP